MLRRTVLAAAGITASLTLGGCVLDRDPVQSGTLVIANEHDQAHTFVVIVSKTNGSDEETPPGGTTPATTPLWQRESTFEIAAGERIRRSESIADPGAFYVEVRTETGETATTWFGLYPAGANGEQVAGGFTVVEIDDEGRLEVVTGYDD